MLEKMSVRKCNINTFGRHIIQHCREQLSDTRGDLNWLLSGIVLACKIIGQELRRLGLSEIKNAGGNTNVHGEVQMGLDVFANTVLTECLGSRGNVALIASEEDEKPIILIENPSDGDYVVVFDPLDGSSNIDINVNVGTIFSIYRRANSNHTSSDAEVLQAGERQIAAGYVLYGSSTILIYTAGNGVRGFTSTFAVLSSELKNMLQGSEYFPNGWGNGGC